MLFILISFIAGVLTVLAPCVLPLLPVIVGGSVSDVRSRLKPYVITISLALSVVAFTLLLKFATIFIDVPQYIWEAISGGILIVFGLITLFPDVWEKVAAKGNLILMRRSNQALASGVKKESYLGDILIGASLGPVFASCSPTYFVILATVLPQSFAMGLIYLIVYAIGLSLALLAIALIGQKLVSRLSGVTDPRGWFKRALGVVFILVGIFVFAGWVGTVQRYFAGGVFDITKFETALLQATGGTGQVSEPLTVPQVDTALPKEDIYPKYREITNPSQFVNTEEFRLSDLVGKKVILLDMMTYSCINCQRTFPYLKAWYEKYKEEGLEIVAIHTPEFAFEHKKENVEAAMRQFGLTFPVVLDNDYGTWNAYGNQYWPHKYLIDIDGYVRYDHIGEGAYEETERQIKELLKERADKLGETMDQAGGTGTVNVTSPISTARSEETYFGAYRNAKFFGNGEGRRIYEDNFAIPKIRANNKFYLGEDWIIEGEYIESKGDADLAFWYDAKEVYLVAESKEEAVITVTNGALGDKTFTIKDSKLYTIISNDKRESNGFFLKVPKGVRLYALTFG